MPLASARQVSFVDMSPSTVMALNDVSTARRKHRSSAGASTAASVMMKESMVAMLGMIMPAPLAMPATAYVTPPA